MLEEEPSAPCARRVVWDECVGRPLMIPCMSWRAVGTAKERSTWLVLSSVPRGLSEWRAFGSSSSVPRGLAEWLRMGTSGGSRFEFASSLRRGHGAACVPDFTLFRRGHGACLRGRTFVHAGGRVAFLRAAFCSVGKEAASDGRSVAALGGKLEVAFQQWDGPSCRAVTLQQRDGPNCRGCERTLRQRDGPSWRCCFFVQDETAEEILHYF